MIDLILLPKKHQASAAADYMTEAIQDDQSEVKRLEWANAKYKANADKHQCSKAFEESDVMIIFLRKEHFPACTYNNLKQMKYDPYKILLKIMTKCM